MLEANKICVETKGRLKEMEIIKTHRILATMIEKGGIFEFEVTCFASAKFTALFIHVAVHGKWRTVS